MIHFELLTRPDCHLCEEMEAVLEEVLPTFGATYSCRNVDEDPDLKQRYGELIPVLLREGRAVAKVRVDRWQLERIVRRKR